jgi:hypothetical protein
MTKEDLELLNSLKDLIKDQQGILQKHNEAFKYTNIVLKRIKTDLHFVTELIIQEKSFTEDVKVKLRKILDWTKNITG